MAVSTGEVATSGGLKDIFVVSGGEVGVDNMTHVEMCPPQFSSTLSIHPHYSQ